MNRSLPYAGVAGITTREEMALVCAAIPRGFQRLVAVGVLASAKTLAGGERNSRSPAPGDIASLFVDDARAEPHPLLLAIHGRHACR